MMIHCSMHAAAVDDDDSSFVEAAQVEDPLGSFAGSSLYIACEFTKLKPVPNPCSSGPRLAQLSKSCQQRATGAAP
jgi:hypothetical protein